MKTYEKYKDSGVEWIGEVPSHWKVMPLKRLLIASLMYGANESAEEENSKDPRYIRITDIDENGNLKDETFKTLNKQKANDYLLKQGDILFARSGATVGKTYLFNEQYQACFAGYLIKASCNRHKIQPDYLIKYTQSGIYDNWKKSIFIQATIQNIGADKYSYLPIIVPPLSEQQAIATYLDKKCTDIDKVIATQQRRIELLQELKQSTITHAVTHGLNPNVKMKDSGVEWIGEVPEHWKKCRLKNFLQLITKPSTNENKIGLENIEGKTGRYIETSTEFEGNGIEFVKNDIVYGKLRPYLQKVWLAEFKGNAVGDFFIFRNFGNCFARYVTFLFLSDGFTKEADGATFGSKMPRVSSDFIRCMQYCLPPLSEQESIATYLDKKCTELDNSISKAQREIDLLQEYKQSLITEVVTGKRKVC